MISLIPRFWRNIRYRYNLIATKCETCGEIFFPPRKLCPNCRRRGKLVEKKLSGRGKIYTYTVVYNAPLGFEMQLPYIIAIVELEEGLRVTAQIVDCDPSEVYIGMPVEAVFRRISEDGEAGLIYYGYKFRPVKEGGDGHEV